jgi:hypothetical protein
MTRDDVLEEPAANWMTDQAEDSSCKPDRGVTARVVCLSLILAACFGYVIPIVDFKFSNTSLGGTHLPVGAVAVALFLVIAVNPLLRAVSPGLGLTRNETLTVYSSCLFSCLVPGRGAENFFIPNVIASFYLATRENRWLEFLQPYLKPWLTPSLTVGGHYNEAVTAGWYTGSGSIPWGAWAVPLLAWGALVFSLYTTLACLGVLLRAQWSEHEALAFPLLRLPLEMTEGSDESARPAFFRNPVMWCGFGLAAFLQLMNGLNLYFPDVPAIPLRISTAGLLTEAPFNQIGPFTFILWPMAVGITYLLTTEVSFSLWFFYLLMKGQLIFAYYAGFPAASLQHPTWTRGWAESFVAYQQIGGYVAYFFVLARIGRGHFRHVLRRAVGREAAQAGESREALSYPVAFWGFVSGSAFLIAWTVAAGVRLDVALVFWLIYLMVAVVMTRVVVECGLLLVQTGWAPLGPLANLFGAGPGSWLGPASGVPLAFVGGALLTDPRGFLLPSFVQSFKLAHDRRIALRPLLGLIAAVTVVSMIVGWWSILRLGYTGGGGLTLDNWWARGNGATQAAQNAREIVRGVHNASWSNWFWLVIGMVTIQLITLARARFPGFPLHPIGLIMCWPPAMYALWFSIFLGWLAKVLITRFGGNSTYRALIPGFLGLVLGDVTMMLFWLCIDGWQGRTGHFLLPQ